MAKDPPKYTTHLSNGQVIVRLPVNRFLPTSEGGPGVVSDAAEAKLPLEIAEILLPDDPTVKVARENRRKHLEHQVKEAEKSLAYLKESLK